MASSLNRALLHLNGADEAADAAKARLKKQNERLEHIGEDMNQIDSKLDEAEDEISGLESTFGMELGGWMEEQLEAFSCSCWGGRAKQEDVDLGGDLIKQGWLRKRGRGENFGWKKRWVMMYPLACYVYLDDAQKKRVCVFKFTSVTEIWSFQEYEAPGDAVKHRGGYPNGFVVKIPRAGMKSEFHYLDARTDDDAADWIKELQKARNVITKNVQTEASADAGENESSEKAGLEMDLISDKLDGLMDKAKGLGEDAKKQGKLVQKVEEQVDHATDRIVTQDQRLRNHINS